MDSLIAALANMGGLGIMAGAILWLHREALLTFREELRLEREQNDTHHRDVLVAIRDSTTSIMTEIRNQYEECRKCR